MKYGIVNSFGCKKKKKFVTPKGECICTVNLGVCFNLQKSLKLRWRITDYSLCYMQLRSLFLPPLSPLPLPAANLNAASPEERRGDSEEHVVQKLFISHTHIDVVGWRSIVHVLTRVLVRIGCNISMGRTQLAVIKISFSEFSLWFLIWG